jgi:hypothetical protein
MYRPIWKTAVFVAALAVLSAGSVACSDDGAAGNNGDSTDSGTITDTSDSGGEDAGATDTGQDPDDAGPADTGEDTDNSGSDVSDTAGSSDAADSSDAGDTSTVDPEVGHSGCTFPAEADAGCTPEQLGDWGPATFLSDFNIADNGDCCRDFPNGDDNSNPDSAMGALVNTLEFALQVNDFNEDIIAPQIESGDIVYLFEYAYWSDAVTDPAVEFNLVFGEDTDSDFAPNFAGNGDFYVDPASLDNGEPKSTFQTAAVTNAKFKVTGGTAPLVLPVGTDLVETLVEDIQIEADVESGTANLDAGGRVALTNGKLSGYITLNSMFASLNTVADNCGCIAAPDLYVDSGNGNWTCQATSADKAACADTTTMCETLSTPASEGAINCEVIGGLVTDQADIDTDGDTTADALSLGATFTGVGASLKGVTP